MEKGIYSKETMIQMEVTQGIYSENNFLKYFHGKSLIIMSNDGPFIVNYINKVVLSPCLTMYTYIFCNLQSYLPRKINMSPTPLLSSHPKKTSTQIITFT